MMILRPSTSPSIAFLYCPAGPSMCSRAAESKGALAEGQGLCPWTELKGLPLEPIP